MLFHELYGHAYNIVTAVLREAIHGDLSLARFKELTSSQGESQGAAIRTALEKGIWPLLSRDGRPLVKNIPPLPPTELEQRWFKAICQDPRVKLFLPEHQEPDFAAVEPLFPPDCFVCYDRYADGDPFDNPRYVQNMRRIVRALKANMPLVIVYQGKNGLFSKKFLPHSLEYSPKDDKFRLLASTTQGLAYVLKVARIKDVLLTQEAWPTAMTPPLAEKRFLVLELEDERNALERALLHFSDLEKETLRLDENHYRVTLRYYERDETEILIRILSFGPLLKVTEPASFVERIRDRLRKQKNLGA